jgi:hypothetical protein
MLCAAAMCDIDDGARIGCGRGVSKPSPLQCALIVGWFRLFCLWSQFACNLPVVAVRASFAVCYSHVVCIGDGCRGKAVGVRCCTCLQCRGVQLVGVECI